MKRSFYALKASLPFLTFGEIPLLDSAKFLEDCSSFISPDQLHFLTGLSLSLREVPHRSDALTMTRYAVWEICLRNTLAGLRAGKLNRDAGRCLVRFAGYESSAAAAARTVFAMTADPLEKELALDRARWELLDNMEWRHPFDFDALCLYRCKLLILEKWSARRLAGAAANLDEAAARSEMQMDKKENILYSKE